MRNVKEGMDSVKMYAKGSMGENRFLGREHEWKEEKKNVRGKRKDH